MATEMVLVPKTRYEKLLSDDKDYIDKIRSYETLLNNNDIDVNGVNREKKSDSVNVLVDDKRLTTQTSDVGNINNNSTTHTATTSNDVDTVATKDQPTENPTEKVAVEKNEEDKVVKTPPVNRPPLPPIDTIIERFPRKYRFYAKRLLAYISKNGLKILNWDGDGVIRYKGAYLRQTNIVDLVKHVFKSIGTPPKGIKQFRQALNEIRVPKVFLKPFLLKPPGVPSKVKKNWIKY
jgi:hypothetical protein